MRALSIFSMSLAVAVAALAEFPTVYNSEPGNPSPMPAEEALKALTLPEGFNATLFASEPQVQNPIALAWDRRGRMWVAENYTYSERAKRFDLSLRDRLIILEDADHDGKAEKRTVFTDNVQMLTSVEVGRGGVWLMCPPQLIFMPDANGDDVPDGPPQVMLDGFTVAETNYHNFANGLRWGPDGWLYGRCGHSCPASLGVPGTADGERVPMKGGIWRFNPGRKVVEVLTHGTTNPWGHDWDENGEMFFVNTVTGHLWELMPGAHLKDGSPSPNPGVYERLDMIADHYHFDTRGSWTLSRDGKANDLGGGHAHIGMMIYQADQWPETWRNKLYTLNMHGRRTNVERLERSGSGYVGRHDHDQFISTDPWFRGLEISTGPEGSGYILDWSDTGECHDSTGVHRTSGRIFRISYGKPAPADLTDLLYPSADGVLSCLKHPNVWFERQMRQQMTGCSGDDIIRTCRGVLAGQQGPLQLRALWMLNAMGQLNSAELLGLMDAPNEYVRLWALRLLTDAWPLDLINGRQPVGAVSSVPPAVLAKLVQHATDDPSALVRLGLASALQRLPLESRWEVGKALLGHRDDAGDKNLPSMTWYGLIPVAMAEPKQLGEMLAACSWPTTAAWMARFAAGELERQPQALEDVLVSAAKADGPVLTATLQGISDGLRGWRKARKPEGWDAFAAAIHSKADATSEATLLDLGAVFGDGRALEAMRAVALDQKAEVSARQAAMRTLITANPPDLRQLCESLLDSREMALAAVKGLASIDAQEVGKAIAKRYAKFPVTERAEVMSVLVSRPAWAKAMLTAMATGTIPPAELSAFNARQVAALGDDELRSQLQKVWGATRESPADKKEAVTKFRKSLTAPVLARANLGTGRVLFQALCATCHTLYGQGGRVGPDLTGSGRASLDYLLENVVDPSATIGADFVMHQLALKDGRALAGIVVARTDKTLTLRTLNEDLVVDRQNIASDAIAAASMMPEGLLQSLPPDSARDLLAYLMQPNQVPLPGQ